MGEGSCYTLAHLPESRLIAIGTTIRAGTGTEPRESEASLLLWDYEGERVEWSGVPEKGLISISALVETGGRLLGTGIGLEMGLLFQWDPDTRSFNLFCRDLPGRPLDHGLRQRSDRLYGITNRALYRVLPGEIEFDEEGLFEVPGPIIDDWLYFGTNHLLRRLQLF